MDWCEAKLGKEVGELIQFSDLVVKFEIIFDFEVVEFDSLVGFHSTMFG